MGKLYYKFEGIMTVNIFIAILDRLFKADLDLLVSGSSSLEKSCCFVSFSISPPASSVTGIAVCVHLIGADA